jgi:hypothetical protein
VVLSSATRPASAPVLEPLSIRSRAFSVLARAVSDGWEAHPTMLACRTSPVCRKPELYAAAGERASFDFLRVIRLRQRDQQGSTHIPAGVLPRQAMGFRAKLTGS